MGGLAERVVRPTALLLALLLGGCGIELVRTSLDPPDPAARAVEEPLDAGVVFLARGADAEATGPALGAALRDAGLFREGVLPAGSSNESSTACEARLLITPVSEPEISTFARELLPGLAFITGGLLAPVFAVWTDREPDLVDTYVLEVAIRGEGATTARYAVTARGTIRAQSPTRDQAESGLAVARAALRDQAIQSLVSRFADDRVTLAQLRAQLSSAPGPELEPLLVTKETYAPRARWRTRKVIGWKNESLGARVAEAKTSELRALVSRLETCMLDLSHEAEVEKDAAQTLTAAGADADAQGKREMSLAYRERVEALRPILTAVKEELDGRGR